MLHLVNIYDPEPPPQIMHETLFSRIVVAGTCHVNVAGRRIFHNNVKDAAANAVDQATRTALSPLQLGVAVAVPLTEFSSEWRL
jgi:hypothetical protein